LLPDGQDALAHFDIVQSDLHHYRFAMAGDIGGAEIDHPAVVHEHGRADFVHHMVNKMHGLSNRFQPRPHFAPNNDPPCVEAIWVRIARQSG
jgi:hypothetical protein